MYDLYFETYKGVKSYVKSQKRYAHQNGYVLTVLNRKRHLEGIWAKDFGTVGYNERLSVNAPVQGSAADIAISAQIIIENDKVLRDLGFVQLLQVHDEIVGECPVGNEEAVEKRMQEIMADCLPRPLNGVVLSADTGHGYTYAEAK